MGQLPELQRSRRRLGLALDPLCHDRWVLGYIRNGSLHPIAASEISRRLMQSRPLLPLSRRALYEKRPIVINSVTDAPLPSDGYDWELDWPAIVYAPVGELGRRPIGLLVLGCRSDHWYTEEDVAYVHSLAITLAPMVSALRGPLGRLSGGEGEVVQLLSHGLSTQEIARATRRDERRATALVASVTRRLQSLGADELAFTVVPARLRRAQSEMEGRTLRL
jgi:DNA-binding CsgD family transcriptional regulator